MKKLTMDWFQAALIRAVKTIAQTLIGMITVGAAFNEINWSYILSVALVAGIVSILTSVAGLPEAGSDGSVYIGQDGFSIEDIDISSTDKDVVRLKIRK